ncbi:MAG TPA: glycosyltransferase family 1 protein [Solirubrobacteraceae bacterium]|nr:glycosyltransferase family 1 protein [Solirubrobacteraceae bacterium]
MHVGMLLATLTPGHVGGSETYVRGLLAAFAAGDGPQRTTVLTHRAAAESLGVPAGDSVALRTLPGAGPAGGGPRRAAWLVREIAAARLRPLRDETVDVVHAPLTIPVPRVAGAPVVMTLHDVTHHEYPASFSLAERTFRRVAYDGSARRAALVITDSEHARAAIVDRLGIAAERVVAIHFGIDHARFHPRPDAADDALLAGLALPARYVAYPANLWPHKNHERLIEALAACENREIELVLTGRRGRRWDALHALATRRGVAHRIHHHGYLPGDAIAALYRRATGMVFPSLAEGFGAPPLEAMACGCPVAASGDGAVAEVTGNAALHFDPRDVSAIAGALERLAGDPPLRSRLRAAGAARAAGFTWAACARRHAEVYERAAACSS